MEPTSGTRVELIFVHGLGGLSHGTWTHQVSGEFWPEWLKDRPGFQNVRVSTFGYNADIITLKGSTLGIPGFANQLLNGLHLDYKKHGPVSAIVRIIVDVLEIHNICRSQHGRFSCQKGRYLIGFDLLTLKAIVDAYLKDDFRHIADNTKGIIFLGTPHHGVDLATILSKVLNLAYPLAKKFPNELQPHCDMIRELDTHFCDRSKTLKLISFSESQTKFGVLSDL